MGAFGRRCPFDLSTVAQASEEMMAAGGTHEKNRAVEELLEEALVDAYGDDEQLWALRQAFEDDLKLPADAFIIGEPVSIVEFDYDGHERRGLTAKCRRDDGSEHVVSASDVVFPEGLAGELHVAAYRMWLGLSPFAAARSGRRAHKATAEDLDLSGRVELAVLSVMQRAARCRLLDSNRVVTLRASGLWEVVPGHIVTIRPRKQWRYGQHPYLIRRDRVFPYRCEITRSGPTATRKPRSVGSRDGAGIAWRRSERSRLGPYHGIQRSQGRGGSTRSSDHPDEPLSVRSSQRFCRCCRFQPLAGFGARRSRCPDGHVPLCRTAVSSPPCSVTPVLSLAYKVLGRTGHLKPPAWPVLGPSGSVDFDYFAYFDHMLHFCLPCKQPS